MRLMDLTRKLNQLMEQERFTGPDGLWHIISGIPECVFMT